MTCPIASALMTLNYRFEPEEDVRIIIYTYRVSKKRKPKLQFSNDILKVYNFHLLARISNLLKIKEGLLHIHGKSYRQLQVCNFMHVTFLEILAYHISILQYISYRINHNANLYSQTSIPFLYILRWFIVNFLSWSFSRDAYFIKCLSVEDCLTSDNAIFTKRTLECKMYNAY